jgi:S1-C subfamily serine protease
MVEVVNLIEMAAISLINADERPEFTEAGPKQRNTSRRGFKVTFGIMPDFTSNDTDGLGVGGVTKGGPAEAAGMKKGDKITGINGLSVGTIYDYMNRLRQLKPGQRVNVDILRDGEPMFLIVEL